MGVRGDTMGDPEVAMGDSGVAMGDSGVAMGVPMG